MVMGRDRHYTKRQGQIHYNVASAKASSTYFIASAFIRNLIENSHFRNF